MPGRPKMKVVLTNDHEYWVTPFSPAPKQNHRGLGHLDFQQFSWDKIGQKCARGGK